jgi:cobalt-zinc-cadmium efflux system outer membrane protein
MARAKTTILAVLLGATSFSIGWTQEPGGPLFAPEALPQAESAATTLGLPDLEQIALERNPTLVQAIAQVRISRGAALQAGLCPNPSVGYVADQIGVAGTAGELHGMFIEQEIVTGGKLQLSRAKYAQEARQAELQVWAQWYRIIYGVRVAFYDAFVQQESLELHAKLLANSGDLARTVNELKNVGQANESDRLRAEVEYQRAQAEQERSRRRLEGAWEELAAMIGAPEMARPRLNDYLTFSNESRLNRDSALAEVLANSPELQFAQAEVVRDRLSLQRERVESIPNLNVRAETGYNFESRDTVAGVEVGLRLPIFDKNQGTILQAQAELMRAEAEVTRVEFVLRQRFARAFAEYESARLLAETLYTQALPNSEKAYRLYLESFNMRRAAWPQVLDAQREYFNLYEEYLDSLLEARRAEAQIATFFLEDGLTQPPQPSPEGHRDSTPRPR